MSGKPSSAPSSLPGLDCACASIRRAARLVTQLYSHEMGWNVEPAQFSLLAVLHRRPGASQAPLGRALGLDKTTLSRNLHLIEKKGWIEPTRAGDRRERGFRLTPSGKKMLAAAKPGWTRAQAKLRTGLKSGDWENILKVLDRVAEAALEARRDPVGQIAPKRGKTV